MNEFDRPLTQLYLFGIERYSANATLNISNEFRLSVGLLLELIYQNKKLNSTSEKRNTT